MRHHRHVPRCQHPAATRRCRARCSGGAGRRQQLPRPARSCAHAQRGTSRLGQPAVRDPRGREPAGRHADPEDPRDPDCRGGVLVSLLRLIGGRR
jgi:hypothetical protein